MDCERIIQAIYLAIDGELEPDGCQQLEEHLARCGPCARRRRLTEQWLVLVRQRTVRLRAPQSLHRRIQAALPQLQPARLDP